ncbi:BA75_03279T0 [Komagataella pastoris]|uniref:BA75_03279T0 n=1 Tax=Komagataella pastoris TaxID=4922 RepID=A0A1B2JD53_PICPA|nr:BA75_03279T0 [Komagataella pastoris]
MAAALVEFDAAELSWREEVTLAAVASDSATVDKPDAREVKDSATELAATLVFPTREILEDSDILMRKYYNLNEGYLVFINTSISIPRSQSVLCILDHEETVIVSRWNNCPIWINVSFAFLF